MSQHTSVEPSDKLSALTTDIHFASHTLGQALSVTELRARLRGLLARMLDDVALKMDALAAKFPPIAGGSPSEDFEEIDLDFIASPADWPAWTDESRWTTAEPTPIEVLTADAPRYEPTMEDWRDYFEARDASWTEADQLVSHGVV